MNADYSYGFSLTTFSPSGKLLQIEYALNAVTKGKMAVGIVAKNGVVIATERKVPSALIEPESMQKIVPLTDGIGAVYSGMGPDFRVIASKAQKKGVTYFSTFKEEIPVTMLVSDTANLMQEYTQRGGVRPFGVSLLIAGYDEEKPKLYQVDPSGAFFSWNATCIGNNYTLGKSFLEKRWNEDMELEDAVITALKTLKETFEGEMTENNIQVAYVGEDSEYKLHLLSPDEIRDYLDEME